MAVVVDLNNLLDQLRSIADAANTTTASPVYLSNNMTNKVVDIFTINPYEIPIQASLYPCVTCWIASKTIDSKGGSVALNQLSGQRKAKVSVKVAGICYNDLIPDVKKDSVARDLYHLMENLELALRLSTTLNASVLWQIPNEITYHEIALGEHAALKAGIMDLQCTVYY